MKSPLIIFTLKFSIILYFAACTGIGEGTAYKSATPQVTKGVWKVTLLNAAGKELAGELAGYTLTFVPSGKIIAYKNTRLMPWGASR